MSASEHDNTKSLFALLIGISRYGKISLAHRVKYDHLPGCFHDISRVHAHLEKAWPGANKHIEILQDNHATKALIVNKFEDHLMQATENDTVFIYFTGHGTQELCDRELFHSETDGKLESLVCYFEKDSEDFLLSDKEIRWLLHRLSLKTNHIVTVFDCCHSEGNTRSRALKTEIPLLIEKRINYVFPKRPWEHFIFKNDIDEVALRQKGENVLLPEGHHVAFSACGSDESAWQAPDGSVFTNELINVLDYANHSLTYGQIISRIRYALRTVYEQQPGLYITSDGHDGNNRMYLNKPFSFVVNSGEIVYNNKMGWLLNRGALHGIQVNRNPITVYDSIDPLNQKIATIKSVAFSHSHIQFIGEEGTPGHVYVILSDLISSKVLRLWITNVDHDHLMLGSLLHYLTEKGRANLHFVEREDDAQYVLRFQNGWYFITRPHDPYRPLVKPISSAEHRVEEILFGMLMHMTNWEFIKALKINGETVLDSGLLDIEFFETDSVGTKVNRLLVTTEGKIVMPMKAISEKFYLTINIRNRTGQKLNCAVLYLKSDFEVYGGFHNPSVYFLEDGNEVTLDVNTSQVLELEGYTSMEWYNWHEQSDYMKLIVSFDKFYVDHLVYDALPPPFIPRSSIRGEEEESVTFDMRVEDIIKIDECSWQTKLVEMAFINPRKDFIDADKLNVMLDDERTHYFANGLYSSYTFDPTLFGYLKPRLI